MLNFHNITDCDMLNGEGLRVVLWVSHCEHYCKGCHNKRTWDKDSGVIFDEQAKEELFEKLSNPVIQGLTLSGGDPLSTLNRDDIATLLREVKEKFPTKDVWCYTGYLLKDLQGVEALKYVDTLVEGRFEIDKLSPSLPWVGSSNQRVLKLNR